MDSHSFYREKLLDAIEGLIRDYPFATPLEPGRRTELRIETERLLLRLPRADDAAAIIAYFKENEAHLARSGPTKPKDFYGEDFWHARIARDLAAFAAGDALRLYLFSKDGDGRPLGSLEFSQITRGPTQSCYLGYGIAARHQGKGLMYEAVRAAIDYAFGELNLRRIMANHLPENERSAQLLSRLGFRRECLAEGYLLIDGVWHDHVLNSLKNPNWRNLVE